MTTTETGTTPILQTRIPEGRALPGVDYGAHVAQPGWSEYFVRTGTCPQWGIARAPPASDDLVGTDRDILIALDSELEAIHRERVDAVAELPSGLPVDQAADCLHTSDKQELTEYERSATGYWGNVRG